MKRSAVVLAALVVLVFSAIPLRAETRETDSVTPDTSVADRELSRFPEVLDSVIPHALKPNEVIENEDQKDKNSQDSTSISDTPILEKVNEEPVPPLSENPSDKCSNQITGSETETVPTTEPVPKPEANQTSEPEKKTTPDLEPSSEPNPDSETPNEPDQETTTEPAPEKVPESDPVSEPDPEPDPEPEKAPELPPAPVLEPAFVSEVIRYEDRIPVENLEKVQEYYELVPEFIREQFEEDGWHITVVSESVSENSDYAGYFDVQRKVIFIQDGDDLHEILHGMGHYLDWKLQFADDESFIEIWLDESSSLGDFWDTYYLNMNFLNEYFAEAFMVMILNPVGLEANCPMTFAFMQNLLGL